MVIASMPLKRALLTAAVWPCFVVLSAAFWVLCFFGVLPMTTGGAGGIGAVSLGLIELLVKMAVPPVVFLAIWAALRVAFRRDHARAREQGWRPPTTAKFWSAPFSTAARIALVWPALVLFNVILDPVLAVIVWRAPAALALRSPDWNWLLTWAFVPPALLLSAWSVRRMAPFTSFRKRPSQP